MAWPKSPKPAPRTEDWYKRTEKELCNNPLIGLGRKRIFFFFYQSSMSVACATGCAAARGRLLVMVGVCEHQTLRGSGARRLSSSGARLLQQRGEVQTKTAERQLVKSQSKEFVFCCNNDAGSLQRLDCSPTEKPQFYLCPGVIWFSAAGAHEGVNTLVSESCTSEDAGGRCHMYDLHAANKCSDMSTHTDILSPFFSCPILQSTSPSN